MWEEVAEMPVHSLDAADRVYRRWARAPYPLRAARRFHRRRRRHLGGKGHATRIVRAAVSWAKARGIGVMLLHASRFGEPIYRREGFEPTTEMRRFLSGPRAHRRRTPKRGPPSR